jgi:iron complex outermembrane receptor protein
MHNNRFVTAGALILALVLVSPGLLTAAELQGRVYGAKGQPIGRAQVTTRIAEQLLTTTTDARGNFVLQLPEPVPAELEVTISALAHQQVAVTVRDAASALVIHLPAQPLFSGEVEVTVARATAGETPVTLTNISREQIERGSWGQDVPVFLSQVPGFYAYSDNGNDIGYSYFTLRGFDMRRTAVSLNGMPLNDATSHGVFFIDHADFLSTTGDIQVQRGVGTNLYGGTAIGGSVDLQTRHPLPERRLRFSARHGSWNTSRWSLEYDTGLIDESWAASFRWSKITSDGYRDQSWVDMWSYFGSIEHYGERTSLRLILFGGPEDTHLAYYGIPREYLDGEISGDRRRDRRFNPLTYANEVDHFFQPHFQLIHSWQINDRLTFQNNFFYFEGDGYYEQYKYDRWLPEYGMEPFPGAPGGELIEETDLIRRRQITEWDGGWIPHLEWRHGGGRGVLQAGAAIRLHESQHWGEVIWAQYYPPGLAPGHRYYDYKNEKTSLHPFVQETWRFNEQWTLLAGVTWTSHRYQIMEDQRNGIAFSQTYSMLLPRLGLTFKPAPGWSLFANISRGGREPAFRDIYDPQDYWSQQIELEEEKLTDFELGAEHHWDLGYTRCNLYWLHFDNAIVWAGGLDDSGVPITANGAVADHRGIELEMAFTPLPRWGARLALSFARNTYDEFIEYDWYGNPIDHSGNRIAGSPERLATFELTGGAGVADVLLSIRHVGKIYLDNTENQRKNPELRAQPDHIDRINDAFTVLDLSAQIDLGQTLAELVQARALTLDLRINNLTDKLYTTFGYMDGSDPMWMPAATRSIYAGITADW